MEAIMKVISYFLRLKIEAPSKLKGATGSTLGRVPIHQNCLSIFPS